MRLSGVLILALLGCFLGGCADFHPQVKISGQSDTTFEIRSK
ncbi:MAG: hypothetical protein PUB69_06265 [Desulfovibrionaceae bacterium]|nr:hypothetical protein [Desulfovibrionaceae bacterium]